jgi:hypothetical protein
MDHAATTCFLELLFLCKSRSSSTYLYRSALSRCYLNFLRLPLIEHRKAAIGFTHCAEATRASSKSWNNLLFARLWSLINAPSMGERPC